ncbi:MAG: hypothetical protein OEZ32_08530 [Nitrospinota bacterium]|nr:hypothetical protein [Nitrospinota bacterium]
MTNVEGLDGQTGKADKRFRAGTHMVQRKPAFDKRAASTPASGIVQSANQTASRFTVGGAGGNSYYWVKLRMKIIDPSRGE